MKTLRAEAWTTHAKTTVVMDDETAITGKRVVAECDTEEHAALFAAAPDLLDALLAMFNTSDPEIAGSPGSPLEMARAAIAKATGA